jgi:TonB family protein
MPLRRIAPWIVSLLAHAAVVLLVPLSTDLRRMQVPIPERRVVLEFEDTNDAPAAPASSSPAGPSIAASALPLVPSLPLPSTPELDPVADAVRAAGRVEIVPGGVPSAHEVLAALPAPTAAPATAGARTDAAAREPTVHIGWTGAARTVVRSVNPRFPAILSERGQEAEVGARITVTPLGAVVDVEITRGSGYTEIDAAVETALRQWIFSRSEGKQNALGTVSYRFPLERRD